MPLPLLILAVAAMTGLGVLRVVRVHLGRTPLPEGRARTLFRIAFLVVPPVVLGVPAGAPLGGLAWVPLYAVILGGLLVVVTIAAAIVERVAKGRTRQVLMLALVGSEGDPEDLPFDPPVTARLAESMAIVDRANAQFPRGLAFSNQVDRADFRSAWGALDDATRVLEGHIVEDRRLGLGTAAAASVTAADARGRLDTLVSIALRRGLAAPA
jgi:putative effector of murein hydrolase LrgA (UPF0299 family)